MHFKKTLRSSFAPNCVCANETYSERLLTVKDNDTPDTAWCNLKSCFKFNIHKYQVHAWEEGTGVLLPYVGSTVLHSYCEQD